jgi:hypothetical protein
MHEVKEHWAYTLFGLFMFHIAPHVWYSENFKELRVTVKVSLTLIMNVLA